MYEDKKSPLVPTDPGFYRELLDNIGDGVYFVDRERRIQYWNEGATRLTGYKAEELLGKCCQDDILCHVDYSGKKLCHDGCPLAATISDGSIKRQMFFCGISRDGECPSLRGSSPCGRQTAP